jgi:hypothetical protein
MTYVNGSIHYKEVKKLSLTAVGSYYKGYPIYRLFRIVDKDVAKADDPTGAGWVPHSYVEYWRPNPMYTKVFQEYVANDEFTVSIFGKRNNGPNETDPSGVSTSFIALTSVTSKPIHKSAAVGTSRLDMADIYRATDQYISWTDATASPDVKIGNSGNPYGNAGIQVWVKVSGNSTSTTTGNTYWYHPVFQNFFLVSTSAKYLNYQVPDTVIASLREGKILSLIAQGNTRPQAIALVDAKPPDPDKAPEPGAGKGSAGNAGKNNGVNKNGSPSEQSAAPKASIKATVRVRGNFGFVAPGEPEGGEPQMVQYYKSGTSQLQTTARHYFMPKPNQINYQNLGSEWTEIERVGRIPLVDWKNYRLMKVSFQFLVLPDSTYRTGAFGGTADDGITLSIDEKLENLRNIAARPYPVILYGFDDLLINANPFSMSTGSGVQFVVNELTISSLIRTPTGSINRATCDITLQEVPIEYINIISLPKLVPGQIIPPPPTITPPDFGERAAFSERMQTYGSQTFVKPS